VSSSSAQNCTCEQSYRTCRGILKRRRVTGRGAQNLHADQNAQHAPSEMNRSSRVRMEAWRRWSTRREKRTCSTKPEKNCIDSDRSSQGRLLRSESPLRDFECNGDVSSRLRRSQRFKLCNTIISNLLEGLPRAEFLQLGGLECRQPALNSPRQRWPLQGKLRDHSDGWHASG
jgi:hypothetical protein